MSLLDSRVVFDSLFKLLTFHTISGIGSIISNTLNSGRILPSDSLTFTDSLYLSPSSIVSLQINNDSFSQLIVGSTLYLDGILEIEFDRESDITGNYYTLIESGLIEGTFSSILNPCASLITIFYSQTSLIVSVNDFVEDLNHVSYISTTGVDDPCCGTFDSPCASFKGVLERMGRKGQVYFHEGNYSFNQGLGNVHDVVWSVIGLGDVIIEGINMTLFNIHSSFVTLNKLNITSFDAIPFQLSNSTVNLNLVSLHSFKILVCLFPGSLFDVASFNLFDCSESSVFVDNSLISGSLSHSLIRLSSSSLLISNSSINHLTANSLIDSYSSSIDLNNSSFADITSTSVFDLTQSKLTLDGLNITAVFSFYFIDSSFGTLALVNLKVDQSAAHIWFSLNDGLFGLHNMTFSRTQNDCFLNTSDSHLIINSLSLINCTGNLLVESVNSSIKMNDLSLKKSKFNYFFKSFDSSLSLSSLNIISTSTSNCSFVLVGSTLQMDNGTLSDISSPLFLEAEHSISIFKNIDILDFNFYQFLILHQSNVNFLSLNMDVCVLVDDQFSIYDVILFQSELTIEGSSLSGCSSDYDFKFSLFTKSSNIVFQDLDQELFFSSLVAARSNLTLLSRFPVISKHVSFDDESFVGGNVPLIDLSKLLSNISISPSHECCNTSFCQISVLFKNVEYLADLLDISVPNNNGFSHNFQLNSLELYLNDLVSFDFLIAQLI
ncbi:hypothetical protein GEMRC1_013781 [Eukaryota sp. GEM-RC1]